MRLSSFTVDLSPPAGFPLAYGFNIKTDAPIHLRGVLLEDRGRRFLIAAVEFIGFYGGAYDQWRNTLAKAAGIPPKQVLLHSVHQHDSLMPPGPEMLQHLAGRKDSLANEALGWDALRIKAAEAVHAAVRPKVWQTVTGIGTAEKRLTGLASNRRLLGPNGKVYAMRFSMTTRKDLKREPVGTIDPLLRTIGFFGSRNKLLATLHFYASHPMGAYGRKMASSDIPGVALSHLRKASSDKGTHIYLTGCAADITFGKYTFADKRKNLKVLGRRLGDGLIANVRALAPVPIDRTHRLGLSTVPLPLPLDTKAHKRATYEKKLRETAERHPALWFALRLEVLKNWKRWNCVDLVCLTLAPGVHVLSLPAETPIEYQLHAQARVPEQFLAVAAYGNSTWQYLTPQHMFDEGGYEPTASICSGAVGKRYYAAIDQLLAKLQ